MATTQEIVDRFPAFATMLGIPEIANLLQLASAPGQNWSSAYFQEQLWNTNWWKNTPESARLWETRKLVDPASAGMQARQMSSNVIGAATSLGLNLTPAEVQWYSEFAMREGWDSATLVRSLVDNSAQDRFQAGTINATRDGLRATASQYGVAVSDSSLNDWSRKVVTGRQTTQGFEDYARMQAKAAFPSLAKEIDAGLTVRQIADPYFQIAAQTLGQNAETMDLLDPKWQRALQSRDDKGQITGPMTTLDWRRTLMTDSAYGYDHSEDAQGSALQLRESLGKTFGLVA